MKSLVNALVKFSEETRSKISGSYFKIFFTLASGAVLAQLITIGVTPILSRLYTPDYFGLFATYSAIGMIISVISCGRYELAIVQPDRSNKAFNIVMLAVGIALVLSLLSLLILAVLFLIKGQVPQFYWLFPALIISSAVNLSLNYFFIKLNKYRLNSISKLIQAIFTALICVLLAKYKEINGLIIGAFCGQLLCSVFLISGIPREFKRKLWALTDVSLIKSTATEYQSFPKYTLVPSFFNVFSSQAINFFLIFTFGGAMAGSYFMAYKIVLLPSTLLSSAFSDIFYQRLIEKKNKSLPVASFISMNARYLLCVGLIFTATIIFFGPQLFMFAFGDKWLLSGNISRIIIFSFLIKFVVSPLTIAFTALDKLNLGAKWQSFMFVSHSLCLLLLYVFKASFYPAIIILTLYEVTIYLVGYFLIAKISGDFDKNKITS